MEDETGYSFDNEPVLRPRSRFKPQYEELYQQMHSQNNLFHPQPRDLLKEISEEHAQQQQENLLRQLSNMKFATPTSTDEADHQKGTPA